MSCSRCGSACTGTLCKPCERVEARPTPAEVMDREGNDA